LIDRGFFIDNNYPDELEKWLRFWKPKTDAVERISWTDTFSPKDTAEDLHIDDYNLHSLEYWSNSNFPMTRTNDNWRIKSNVPFHRELLSNIHLDNSNDPQIAKEIRSAQNDTSLFVACLLNFLLQPTEALKQVQQELGYKTSDDKTITAGIQIRTGGKRGLSEMIKN